MKIEKRLYPADAILLACLLLFIVQGCKKLDALPSTLKKQNSGDTTIQADPGLTSTLAGNGGYGYADGQGSAAVFNNPNGTAVDASGNIYVTDQANHMIRKITAGGMVSTIAGNGSPGYANGMGKAASFNNPIGITVDALGNLYVADFGNNLIRKITPDGTVSTLAGTGVIGFDDGPAATATFNGPAGIAVDKAGDVFVTDNHSVIRKITPDGTVSTFAGNVHAMPGFADGTGINANFNLPEGLAIDANDNLYVADNSNNMIRKVTPGGVVTTLAGSLTPGFTNGSMDMAAFHSPYFVAVDAAGNVYVTDNGNDVVRKISAGGTVSTVAGSSTVGFADGKNNIASFNDLHGIAVDATGNIYVGDEQNGRIRKIVPGISQ